MTTETTDQRIHDAVDPERAIATIVAAFTADPILRWIYPDAARYLLRFPELVQLIAGGAFEASTADVGPDYAGAALWLPPGTKYDEQGLIDLLASSIDPERQDSALAFLDQIGANPPPEGAWYLPFIGVDPSRQGQGHGSALLEGGLARADRDHRPAYLEASSARNRALYERYGFEVVGEIQGGDSPPLWPMLRAPR